MEEQYFIGVAGIIGAGKTEFTKDLAEFLNYKPYLEPVEENPYLNDFYKDMKRYAFTMQIHLLHARLDQHREIINSRKGAVQDRTIYEDTIFADILKNEGHIDEREMKTYKMSFGNMLYNILYPDIIVYLDVSPETALERTKKRNRNAERTISLDYLIKLHEGYKEFIEEMSSHSMVLAFDWNNFGSIIEVAKKIKTASLDQEKFLKSFNRLGNYSRGY